MHFSPRSTTSKSPDFRNKFFAPAKKKNIAVIESVWYTTDRGDVCMTTFVYKECHDCGKLLRFSSEDARKNHSSACPFCDGQLVDSPFTLTASSEAAAARDEKEQLYSNAIFNRYLRKDPERKRLFYTRLSEEEGIPMPPQTDTRELLLLLAADVVGCAAVVAVMTFSGVPLSYSVGVMLFMVFVIVIATVIKEVDARVPPKRRGGSSSSSTIDPVVFYTVYHGLSKHDCDCNHHNSSHCDCNHGRQR